VFFSEHSVVAADDTSHQKPVCSISPISPLHKSIDNIYKWLNRTIFLGRLRRWKVTVLF